MSGRSSPREPRPAWPSIGAAVLGALLGCAAVEPRALDPEAGLPRRFSSSVARQHAEWMEYRMARAKNRRAENRKIGAMAAIAAAQSATMATEIATVATGVGTGSMGGASVGLAASAGATSSAPSNSNPGADAPACTECDALAQECEGDPVPHQRSRYCAAACVCDCYGNAECATANRAKARNLGPECPPW